MTQDADRSTTVPPGAAAADNGGASRRTRRLPIAGVLVALEAPTIAPQPWVVDAIDINANGMGLVLPPEIPEDAEVLLSFSLSDAVAFSRLAGTVRHHAGASGGVRFGTWPQDQRLELLEFLVRAYESEV